MIDQPEDWDKYWVKLNGSFLADLYRKLFLAGPISRSFEKYMPRSGVFVEAGSGSSMSSCYIKKRKRKMIALDFSQQALDLAINQNNIDGTVLGDIRKMPFEDKTLDGIWNLGVMEHLTVRDINIALSEFHRVLKNKGKIILLWPAKYNIMNNIMPWMFPPMPNELKSRKQGRAYLRKNGFKCLAAKVTIMGDIILVGEKI